MMPSHKPDSDPFEETQQPAGVGPWIENAKSVLDGLRVLNRSIERLRSEFKDLVQNVKEEWSNRQEDAERRISDLEKLNIKEEAARVARAEVKGQQRERISFWTVVLVGLGSGGAVTFIQWIASLLHAGK